MTFPGKRKLTARVCGRRLPSRTGPSLTWPPSSLSSSRAWRCGSSLSAGSTRRSCGGWSRCTRRNGVRVLTVLLGVVIIWLVTRVSLKMLNGLLKLLPRFRRRMRPWLRKVGLKLLPPRRRKTPEEPLPPDEILELDPKQRRRITKFLATVQAVAAAFRCRCHHRLDLRHYGPPASRSLARRARSDLGARPSAFLLASAMFAVFLLCFRAFTWRRVLKGFGYKLPLPRRRTHLGNLRAGALSPRLVLADRRSGLPCKPYGVPGSIVSTSQILEICIFLFANVLIAGCASSGLGRRSTRTRGRG